MRSLQMDVDDEISNLVDLHMGMFDGGWKSQDLQGLLWLDHHKNQLTEVADSSRLQDRMKVWFVQKRAEEEAFAWFLCDRFACLRMSMSKDQRLISELKALGEWGDVVRCLDHVKEIVTRESTKLGVLKQLLAGTHVRLGLKDSYVADMKEKEWIRSLRAESGYLLWQEFASVLQLYDIVLGICVPRSSLAGIALVERANVDLDLARPLPSFVEEPREGCRPSVATSNTGKRIPLISKGRPSERRGEVRHQAPQSNVMAQKAQVQASRSGDASTPLNVDSDPDIHEFPYARELKDATDCRWVVSHVTPPSWKQYLRDISIEQLCDIHDKAYMRQAANYEQTLSILRAKVEGLESERERLKASEIQVLQEIDSLRQDRAATVSKVFPDATMKLVHSDEMGVLVARLVRAAIIHGRCTTFEEVAKLKEPFVLEKMPDYRTSSKDEYDRAGEDMANASYPFLSKFTLNPYASVEQLLSMKPRSLRSSKAL
ncbi:hypothetical protein Tco_0537373 [Tanacetum coccineum]